MSRSLLLWGFSFIVLAAAAGCEGPPLGAQNVEQARNPETLKQNALEIFREDRVTLATYRSGVQQLNNYLDLARSASDAMVLSQAERDLIEKQLLKDLVPRGSGPETRESRTKEVERKSFSIFDAYHLDSCFLFRDAARSLRNYVGEPPPRTDPRFPEYQLNQARQAFGWVMRQVAYQPRTPGMDAWPAHEILRRGTGDEEERARVFLSLCEQLDLDGCMVTRTVGRLGEGGQVQSEEVLWTPGVRLGNQVYLFDCRAGKPIADAQGRSVATLAEARKNPEILKRHYAGSPDPVTAAQIAKASLLVPASLPALSPRMRELQSWLIEAENRVILHQDLAAALKRFQGAGLDAEVRLWTARGVPGYPAIVLPRYVENPLDQPRFASRLVQTSEGVIAWQEGIATPRRALIPAWVHQLAAQIGRPDRTARLYQRFDNMFLSIRVQPTQVQEFRVQTGERGEKETVRVQSGGVRDLLVRGRPQEAIEKVLEREYTYDKAMDIAKRDPGAAKDLRENWAPRLIEQERKLAELILQRGRGAGPAGTALQLESEINIQARIADSLWSEKEIALGYQSLQWALPELREHLTYFMALAKLELAVQAEQQAARQGKPEKGSAGGLTPRQHWQSAAEWLERYQAMVQGRPRNQWLAATDVHLAACQEALKRLP